MWVKISHQHNATGKIIGLYRSINTVTFLHTRPYVKIFWNKCYEILPEINMHLISSLVWFQFLTVFPNVTHAPTERISYFCHDFILHSLTRYGHILSFHCIYFYTKVTEHKKTIWSSKSSEARKFYFICITVFVTGEVEMLQLWEFSCLVSVVINLIMVCGALLVSGNW